MEASAKGHFGKAQKARNDALRELATAHQEEFDGLLAKHRSSAGLPADPSQARKQAQIDKAKAKLVALGVDVSSLN